MMVSAEPCVDTISGCSYEVYSSARASLSNIEITWLIFEFGFVLDQTCQSYTSGWPSRGQWRVGYFLLASALLMRVLSLWPSFWMPYVDDWIDSGSIPFGWGAPTDEGRRALKGASPSTGFAYRVTVSTGPTPDNLADACYRAFQIITSLNALIHSLELLPFLNRVHQPFGVMYICIEQMMVDLVRFMELYLIVFLAFSITMIGFSNVRNERRNIEPDSYGAC